MYESLSENIKYKKKKLNEKRERINNVAIILKKKGNYLMKLQLTRVFNLTFLVTESALYWSRGNSQQINKSRGCTQKSGFYHRTSSWCVSLLLYLLSPENTRLIEIVDLKQTSVFRTISKLNKLMKPIYNINIFLSLSITHLRLYLGYILK